MTIIKFPDKENSCFSGSDDRQTVLRLPVAQRPFHRIRFDPVESKVRVIPPVGALNWLAENLQQGAPVKAVDLDGPGDPLNDPEPTLETLLLIHRQYPEIALGITTLGLHADKLAGSLVEAGVSRVTLLIDAVNRQVANKLYAWIRPGRKTIPLTEAIEILLDGQQQAVRSFKKENCRVTIRTTVYPGFNATHITEIAERMAAFGADDMVLTSCKKSSLKEDMMVNPPDPAAMQKLQKIATEHLPAKISAAKDPEIGRDCPSLHGTCAPVTPLYPKPPKDRPNVAVVSSSGMEVDIHLGQAHQVLIYGPREDGLVCLLGTRPVPEPGTGISRWQELAASLHDCFAILAASAGESPRRILAEQGITVLITENEIEGTIDVLYHGIKKRKKP